MYYKPNKFCVDCGAQVSKSSYTRCLACARKTNTRKVIPADQRFWKFVDRSGGPNACWPWMGNRNRNGYGLFTSRRPNGTKFNMRAHRFALILDGRDPGELHGLHACDNPSCCNPAHLFVGTDGDNADDKCSKGRQKNGASPGERNGSAKLTEADVLLIRAEHERGVPWQELAARFGMSKSGIQFIIYRMSWKHI